MATASKTKGADSRVEIPWPKNLVVEGILSFPLTSEDDLAALQEWRTRRNIAPPKYEDKIGANLLLTQDGYDKARTYLSDTYLPFVKELYDLTNGKKGLASDLVDELIEQVKAEQWLVKEGRSEKPNLPIRYLTEKDQQNAPEGYVYKIKFSGPYDNKPFAKKAIIKDEDGNQVAVRLSEIDLPEERSDPNALWWGSNWHFRVGMRMNAFDAATLGVTAYANTLYLLPHKGLPVLGGGNDADVLEDGDDWE